MAIYIKGVEMPKHGYTIITLHDDGSVYCRKIEKGKTVFANFIKATYIPEPHGRLIDADKLADDLEIDGRMFNQVYKLNCASWLRSKSTPTVIEGSE